MKGKRKSVGRAIRQRLREALNVWQERLQTSSHYFAHCQACGYWEDDGFNQRCPDCGEELKADDRTPNPD